MALAKRQAASTRTCSFYSTGQSLRSRPFVHRRPRVTRRRTCRAMRQDLQPRVWLPMSRVPGSVLERS